MKVVMENKGQDIATSVNNINYWWGLFFIPVFFIGNLIFINIFVGVLILKVQNITNAYD
jgi:hypothetical protein